MVTSVTVQPAHRLRDRLRVLSLGLSPSRVQRRVTCRVLVDTPSSRVYSVYTNVVVRVSKVADGSSTVAAAGVSECIEPD